MADNPLGLWMPDRECCCARDPFDCESPCDGAELTPDEVEVAISGMPSRDCNCTSLVDGTYLLTRETPGFCAWTFSKTICVLSGYQWWLELRAAYPGPGRIHVEVSLTVPNYFAGPCRQREDYLSAIVHNCDSWVDVDCPFETGPIFGGGFCPDRFISGHPCVWAFGLGPLTVTVTGL